MTETSKEFASALFDLAMDNREEEAVLEALTLLKHVFAAQPEALAMYASPAIPKRERLEAMEKALDGTRED